MVCTCSSKLNNVVLTLERVSQSHGYAAWHVSAVAHMPFLGNHRLCFVIRSDSGIDWSDFSWRECWDRDLPKRGSRSWSRWSWIFPSEKKAKEKQHTQTWNLVYWPWTDDTIITSPCPERDIDIAAVICQDTHNLWTLWTLILAPFVQTAAKSCSDWKCSGVLQNPFLLLPGILVGLYLLSPSS